MSDNKPILPVVDAVDTKVEVSDEPEPEPEPEPKKEGEEEEEEELAEGVTPEQANHMFMNTMQGMLKRVKAEISTYDDLRLSQSVESAKIFRETAKRLFNITVTEQITRMNADAHAIDKKVDQDNALEKEQEETVEGVEKVTVSLDSVPNN